MENDNNDARQHDGEDGDELGHDEEVVEPSAGLGADGVGGVDDDEDENGEELVLDASCLVGDADGGEDALDEDDGEDGDCRGHDGDDPGPCCQKAKDVAKDVAEVWLYTT